jgi:hypothetical protein
MLDYPPMKPSFTRIVSTWSIVSVVLLGAMLGLPQQVKAQMNDDKIPILETEGVDGEWVWYYVSWNQLNAAGAWFPGESGKQPDTNELAKKALAISRQKHEADVPIKITEITFHNTARTIGIGGWVDRERQAKKGHWFCAVDIEIGQRNVKEEVKYELYVLLLDGTLAEAKRNTPAMKAQKLMREKWLQESKQKWLEESKKAK